MAEWFQDLQLKLDQTWQQLARGVADRRAPTRHPTLATVDRDGWPKARTVFLRAADRSAGTLDVYTDAASAKVDDLRRTPNAALHVWHPRLRLQLRLRAEARVLVGADVSPIWAELSEAQRRDYGGQPEPGRAISEPTAEAAASSANRFAILRFALLEIETLHLGRELHYRALFKRAQSWSGTWLAP